MVVCWRILVELRALAGITWASAARIISVTLDGRLICWDGALKMEGVVDGIQGPLNCLGSDATGNLIYGGTQGTVAVTPPSGPTVKATVGKGIQHVITHSKGYSGAPEACVISLDDCIRRLDLTSGALSAPVEVKEFVVGAGWLDVSETMLFMVTGKRSFLCASDKEILWSKPAATERRATSMAVIPGSPGKLAVALEQPGGYVGGVASNEFDILYFEAGSWQGKSHFQTFSCRCDIAVLPNQPTGSGYSCGWFDWKGSASETPGRSERDEILTLRRVLGNRRDQFLWITVALVSDDEVKSLVSYFVSVRNSSRLTVGRWCSQQDLGLEFELRNSHDPSLWVGLSHCKNHMLGMAARPVDKGTKRVGG